VRVEILAGFFVTRRLKEFEGSKPIFDIGLRPLAKVIDDVFTIGFVNAECVLVLAGF
jgi:hypothetical protein